MKYEETAKRLRLALSNMGITQQELSNKTGIGKSSISQWINGRNRPDSFNAYDLSQVLGVSPDWLMGFDVPMVKAQASNYTNEILELEMKFTQLTPEHRQDALRYMAYLQAIQNNSHSQE